MVKVQIKGSTANTEKLLKKAKSGFWERIVRDCAEKGLSRLSDATPVDTGKTASMWRYVIKNTSDGSQIEYFNDNINNGYCIALLLQYGHATKNHGFVKGVDYVNPAMAPVAEDLANAIWKELIS